jgi:hypothetical protein
MPVGPDLSRYWKVPKYRGPIIMVFVFFALGIILVLWGGGFRQPSMLSLSIMGAVSFVIAFVILIGFVILPSKGKYPS